jgi:hypothetical protein
MKKKFHRDYFDKEDLTRSKLETQWKTIFPSIFPVTVVLKANNSLHEWGSIGIKDINNVEEVGYTALRNTCLLKKCMT